MPRKRIKKKGKKRISYNILDDFLYEAICSKISMSELLGEYEHLGYKCGQYFMMFDKNDPEVCKEIWDRHKVEVMERWEKDPGYSRMPYLRGIVRKNDLIESYKRNRQKT